MGTVWGHTSEQFNQVHFIVQLRIVVEQNVRFEVSRFVDRETISRQRFSPAVHKKPTAKQTVHSWRKQ